MKCHCVGKVSYILGMSMRAIITEQLETNRIRKNAVTKSLRMRKNKTNNSN
jgi:hypothetical protein